MPPCHVWAGNLMGNCVCCVMDKIKSGQKVLQFSMNESRYYLKTGVNCSPSLCIYAARLHTAPISLLLSLCHDCRGTLPRHASSTTNSVSHQFLSHARLHMKCTHGNVKFVFTMISATCVKFRSTVHNFSTNTPACTKITLDAQLLMWWFSCMSVCASLRFTFGIVHVLNVMVIFLQQSHLALCVYY